MNLYSTFSTFVYSNALYISKLDLCRSDISIYSTGTAAKLLSVHWQSQPTHEWMKWALTTTLGAPKHLPFMNSVWVLSRPTGLWEQFSYGLRDNANSSLSPYIPKNTWKSDLLTKHLLLSYSKTLSAVVLLESNSQSPASQPDAQQTGPPVCGLMFVEL